jgi:hypothetical protein
MNAKRPQITLNPVKSSQIASVGHDPATNTLAIQFKSKTGAGSVYHYPNVSAEQYQAFTKAESLGKHFGAHIKGNPKHPHTKLGD